MYSLLSPLSLSFGSLLAARRRCATGKRSLSCCMQTRPHIPEEVEEVVEVGRDGGGTQLCETTRSHEYSGLEAVKTCVHACARRVETALQTSAAATCLAAADAPRAVLQTPRSLSCPLPPKCDLLAPPPALLCPPQRRPK